MLVPEDGRLAQNIVYFARALRAAGLPVGTSRALQAVRAAAVAGFESRADFYHLLAACFLSRPEHRAVFDQVFAMFWRDPQLLEKMMALMLPELRRAPEERKKRPGEDRAAQAMTAGAEQPEPPALDEPPEEVEFDATLTMSTTERLAARDFEQMSLAEQAAAKRAIARLRLPVRPIATRRTQAALRGALPDWRRTMRAAMRPGGEVAGLARRARRQRWPALVVLCDISGSMAGYSRMLLHFLHAASNAKGAGWSAVHAFTFGTRLTNITRHLRARDVDEALARAGAEAQDWEGGTRIGACLAAFNRDWSRRVLGQGAVVLLITDGLDREDGDVSLAAEMQRLHLSCRRLIWLNPLLRWDGFAPRAAGIRAMLPHVDSFRASHSIASLAALAAAISSASDGGEKARLLRAMRE